MKEASSKNKLHEKLHENNLEIISGTLTEETPDNIVTVYPNTFQIVPEFAISLNEARQRLQLLQSFVKEMMVENVDYGIIQGCKKPSLYKPGAEKLCDIFGFSKHVEVINRTEDWEKKIFHYEVKTTLLNKRTGMIEAEGIGCCNNKERKYVNQDSFTVMNTILKMAKKRAFVDAVLSATRSSDIFTQDIEDMEQNKTDKQQKQSDKQGTKTVAATKTQLSKVMVAIKQSGISFDAAKDIMIERYHVMDSKMLTSNQVEDFINYLKNYIAV